MDLNDVMDNIIVSTSYDVAKFFVSYILAKIVWGKWLDWRWGGWKLIVKRGEHGLAEREMSSECGKRTQNDKNEFSVYVKGVVSPYEFINIDICSDKAEEIGLVHRPSLGRLDLPRNQRVITIDLSKNPAKPSGQRSPL
ncbi:hypothetical protein [Candidatus Electronema sp. JC]|uniref:hypothetical protein n=1 Tax=Candidatus Electronema sp. JC TaxID=3401570 RepID=UPI003B436B38